MLIVTVKMVFTLATMLFAWGYMVSRRNNALHRRLMVLGFVATLSIAVVLVVGVHLLGQGYAPAQWLLGAAGGPGGARMVLLAHRGVATLTLVLLIAQMVAGARRLPLHRRLHRWVVPFWLVTYLSGLVLFV